MKAGDLVSWCCPIDTSYEEVWYEEDLGIVTKVKRDSDGRQVYVMWQSGEGSGWYLDGNPNIGAISGSR